MTNYTRDELDQDWEFKIVRSNMAAFRSPEKFKDLVKQESQAGWVLVEKFDDSRVRFKRPASARARDPMLPAGVDPYRSYYGMGPARMTVVILAIVFAVLLMIFLIAMIGAGAGG